jgi:hypothetical protein
VVFFCCCHSDQALDRMQATQGGAGYSVDFTAVAISQKYVRVFQPGRPLMPTLFFQAGSQDVTVTPSGLKDITASLAYE